MSPQAIGKQGGKSRWSGHLVATVLLSAIALVVVVRDGFPMLMAIIRPSADAAKVDSTTPLLAKHAEVHGTNLKRLENRYLFSIPPNWKRKAPPPPPPPPVPREPVAPPPPPPPPADYTGPKPIGMFGSAVYFQDGNAIELGKESGGVKVVEIVSTWELKLQHKGKVYDVSFGNRLPDDLFRAPASRSSVPGITSGPSGSTGTGSGASGASNAAPGAAPGAATGASPGGATGRSAGAESQTAGGAPVAPPAGSASPSTDPAAQPEATPPAGGETPPAGAGSDLKAAPATETVLPEVPAAITEAAISGMSLTQAEEALQRIVNVQSRSDIDADTLTRLRAEMELLVARIRQG